MSYHKDMQRFCCAFSEDFAMSQDAFDLFIIRRALARSIGLDGYDCLRRQAAQHAARIIGAGC